MSLSIFVTLDRLWKRKEKNCYALRGGKVVGSINIVKAVLVEITIMKVEF